MYYCACLALCSHGHAARGPPSQATGEASRQENNGNLTTGATSNQKEKVIGYCTGQAAHMSVTVCVCVCVCVASFAGLNHTPGRSCSAAAASRARQSSAAAHAHQDIHNTCAQTPRLRRRGSVREGGQIRVVEGWVGSERRLLFGWRSTLRNKFCGAGQPPEKPGH